MLYLPISFAAKHGIWVNLSQGDVKHKHYVGFLGRLFQKEGLCYSSSLPPSCCWKFICDG